MDRAAFRGGSRALADSAEPSPKTEVTTAAFAVAAVQCADHDAGEACRYQVAWEINPHMKLGAVDFEVAARQHAALLRVLEQGRADVRRLPFIHGAHDSVFVKDPALLLARRGRSRALLARLRHPERQREHTDRARVLAEQGFDVIGGCPFEWEGGDVVMWPSGQGMFLGHGWRSSRHASAWLERTAGMEVVPLELRDPRLYHLDMALAMLPAGTALVCADAIAPHSLRALERARGVSRVVTVSRDLALDFGLNFVLLGSTAVVGSYRPELVALLASLGHACHVVPLDQFHLAGGSAACLVAAVHHCADGR